MALVGERRCPHGVDHDGVPRDDQERPEPVGLPALLAWRRTGLVLCWVAMVCGVGLALVLLTGEQGDGELAVVGALLGLGAFVAAWLGLTYLRRAWADPEVAGDPTVIRAQRWASLATACWVVGVLIGAVGRWTDTGWLRGLAAGLGIVAVAVFAVTVVRASRWRPVRR
jgi:hypothetical protein